MQVGPRQPHDGSTAVGGEFETRLEILVEACVECPAEQHAKARDPEGAEELARRHGVGTRVEALRSLAAETGTT